MRTWLAFVLVAAAGCTAERTSIFEDDFDARLAHGDGKGDVGGRPESGYRAVGSLRMGGGSVMCSATLILPNAVLTAAHCLKPLLEERRWNGGGVDALDGGEIEPVDGGVAPRVDAGDVADLGGVGGADGGVDDVDLGDDSVDDDLGWVDDVDLASSSPVDLGPPPVVFPRVASFAIGSIDRPDQIVELDLDRSAYDLRYDKVRFDWDDLADPHHDVAIIFLKAPIQGIQLARIVKVDAKLPNPCAYRSIGYGTRAPYEDATDRRSALKCYDSETPDHSDIRVYAPTGATCYGDSGGALAYAGVDEPMRVVGVTSRLGDKDQQDDPCHFGSTAYYTSAYEHRAFISEAIERFSP